MKKCTICDQEVIGQRNKIYCSNKCKQKSFNSKSDNKTKFKSHYIRSIKRKLKLIEMKGGGCKECGYNKNISALDFHHRDPSEKESKLDIRVLSNRSWEFILKESEKCDLLCSNCHREEHNNKLSMSNVHEILNDHFDMKISKDVQQKIERYITSINPNKCDCGKEIAKSSSKCVECNSISRRKVERPTYEDLVKEISESNLSIVGRKYGVHPKTIRKWVKKYEKEN